MVGGQTTAWDGTGRLGQDGMGSYAMGRDGTGRDEAGKARGLRRGEKGRDGMGRHGMGRHGMKDRMGLGMEWDDEIGRQRKGSEGMGWLWQKLLQRLFADCDRGYRHQFKTAFLLYRARSNCATRVVSSHISSGPYSNPLSRSHRTGRYCQ